MKMKTAEGMYIETQMRRRKVAWLQSAYRVILSSHRQLSKACLLLKSYPHGFIWGRNKR